MSPDTNPANGRRGIYLLPNLLTTACLFSGFYAVIAAIDGNFERAGIAIFVAMLFDGLDGRVARLTGTDTQFGKEFDSMADMVSFGLAPAIVCYQWGMARIVEYGTAWGRFGWVAAFFYVASAAMRLARFNARAATADKRYFEGLPSPSAAAIVAAFVWLAHKYQIEGLAGLTLAFVVTASAGALMVSRFSYPSFKDRAAGERVRYSKLLLVPVVFALIALDPPAVLLALFAGFGLSAPLVWLWRRTRRRPRDAAG